MTAKSDFKQIDLETLSLLCNLVKQKKECETNIAAQKHHANSIVNASEQLELCKSTRQLKGFLDLHGSQNCASARILSKQITPASIDAE